ncbi:MAG: hypothetical protein K0S82_741 [Gaiellaceae bacterium]|nr:hypothetical protein [Gaiellaceae bacterium]
MTSPRALVLCVIGLLLLAACGGSNDAETTGEPGEIAFELDEVSDAGVAGVRATLSYETPEKTTIVVDGLDEGEPAGGGANPVVLRSGTCDEPKNVVFELEALRGSTSETTVDLALTALLNGDYNIQIGLPSNRPDVIACGDIPDEVPATEDES